MPIISIQLPESDLRKARNQARREGFKSPTDWAKFLVTQSISLEESPRIKPSKIVLEMKKTGLYKTSFLRGLEKSLLYADKAVK